MQFRRSQTFHDCFTRLPDDVKNQAKERFKLFKSNPYYPYHPSLHIKPMRGWKGVWEGHISEGYVFTFHRENDPETGEIIIVFRKIGKHDIYNNP